MRPARRELDRPTDHAPRRGRLTRVVQWIAAGRQRSNRGWLGRRGAAALEFALVVGPLMTVMFGFMATNVLFFTWAAMQDSAQYAARMVATGQIKNFANGAITLANTTSTVVCSGTLNTTMAEYYACQGLPTWATFTVTASEDCAVPSVSVSISVSATSAALADIYAIFAGKTIVAQSVLMKEGVCP